MSFTRTSEGRVFFQNADNDDLPKKTPQKSAPGVNEPVMPRDNVQMQILMLLKNLNTKLKSSKQDHETLKQEISGYKKTIKILEEKANSNDSNYLDLEQKLSQRQGEVSKKADRVEQSVNKTLGQISEAKNLVKALEEKASTYDNSIESIKSLSKKQTQSLTIIKDEIASQKKRDEKLNEKQKQIEKTQNEQGEKMVSNVAAYVALTKRVSESEARHEVLDNKIEEARSDYIKLDRKIDKAIEDRNRILRKVERIEQAVLETRDALNAKAMVLLTDQGAVSGVHMPQNADEMLDVNPAALDRRIQDQEKVPAWRRPLNIKGSTLVMIMVIVLLVGWIANGAFTPAANNTRTDLRALPPAVSLEENYSRNTNPQSGEETDLSQFYATAYQNEQNDSADESVDYKTIYAPDSAPVEDMSTSRQSPNNEDYGIKIHKGYSDPAEVQKNPQVIAAPEPSYKSDEMLDLENADQLARAFTENQDKLASQLNDIEPGTPAEKPTKIETTSTASYEPSTDIKPETTIETDNRAYISSLKKRVSPDPSLNDIAKKIENQAFEGIPEAQHDMGALYVAGHGQVEQDLERAVFWFTEASQNGIANAKYNLGVLNHQGIGVTQNLDRAMALYKGAADMGHPEAQYNLGIANIEGIGVPYSPEKAAFYFEKAANQGVMEAAYNLGLIYENGLLGQPQPEDALTWYKIAADAGSPEAQSALEQLANSLGIKVEDVKRIVDKVRSSQESSQPLTTDEGSYLISEIQDELMQRGLYPGPIDGALGPMTQNAIKNFQRAANLHVTGAPSGELLTYLRSTSQYVQR